MCLDAGAATRVITGRIHRVTLSHKANHAQLVFARLLVLRRRADLLGLPHERSERLHHLHLAGGRRWQTSRHHLEQLLQQANVKRLAPLHHTLKRVKLAHILVLQLHTRNRNIKVAHNTDIRHQKLVQLPTATRHLVTKSFQYLIHLQPEQLL